jgi:hypothetical protein
MSKETFNMQSLQAEKNLWSTHNSADKLATIFSYKVESYLNELTLFMIHFNDIPNTIEGKCINVKLAMEWFIKHYSASIKEVYFNKRPLARGKEAGYDDVFFFLFDDLIVFFDHNMGNFKLLFRKTDMAIVDKIEAELKKFTKKADRYKPTISLILQTAGLLEIKELEISKPRLKISDNYNDDFDEIHNIIYKRLSKKNDKGLVMLHGKPGTGKTSYLRYLISQVKKPVIFLPPSLAGAITNPALISLLTDNHNSIFIIEDAENIVMDRERNGASPVSALLNITDGLLSDCLNIQLICSFNTDLSKVDNALMRKGRLIAKYEFKELATHKAQALSDKIGFDTTITKPMTLTEIYNQHEMSFEQTKHQYSIGFTAN